MRALTMLLAIALLAAACSSESGDTSPATTAITLPPATTTTTTDAVPTTTTGPILPGPASTTTTSLFVPPPECALDLPLSTIDEVTGSEVAVFANAANPIQLWSLALGDRSVQMDTLGDRVYLATGDGYVASLDVDPCGLDWVVSVGETTTGLVAAEAGVFVTSGAGLLVLDRIEGTASSFALTTDQHVMTAGPDVLAVSDGDSVFLYDYLTQQGSSLAIGETVSDIAASAEGVLVARGITVELRTWLGALVWARDLPEPVHMVAAAETSVMVQLANGNMVVLDLGSGEVRWELAFPLGSNLAFGPIDHGEMHVLEFASEARHHHLAIGDGSSIFVSESPLWQTFPQYDDELIVVVDDGDVTARSLLEQDLWTITTGADGLGNFTEIDVTGGFIVALSYSAERF